MNSDPEEERMPVEVLAETENFAILMTEDDEGEPVYNIEMGTVTLHLFQEDWEELIELIRMAQQP